LQGRKAISVRGVQEEGNVGPKRPAEVSNHMDDQVSPDKDHEKSRKGTSAARAEHPRRVQGNVVMPAPPRRKSCGEKNDNGPLRRAQTRIAIYQPGQGGEPGGVL